MPDIVTHHTTPVKRCRSNSSQEEPTPKRTKTTGARFNPIGRPQRQNIARALELTYENAVYFSLSEELTRPRRIHKTRGDGNCYFRALSFILTGAENQHVALRNRVVSHMQIPQLHRNSRTIAAKTLTLTWTVPLWTEMVSGPLMLRLYPLPIYWTGTSTCIVKWAKSSLGKDFPHSSLSASQLMRASIWITVRVTTATLFWVFSDIWWTSAAVVVVIRQFF